MLNIEKRGGCGIIASERNNFSWPFINSLFHLQSKMGKYFQIFHIQTGDQATARNLILKMAKEQLLDYVVMIDSDMTFPDFGVICILERMEQYQAKIGAGVYFIGAPPYNCTASEKIDGQFQFIKDWSKTRYIDSCGMGFTVIDKELFDIKFGFENGMGEDTTFCTKAKDLGHQIVLVPEVKCGHLRLLELNEDLIRKIYV